uniref:PH domain-containing protein n=1 Tax=Ascaris lumbricoides TaxID=6252 RepID=A0A0M3IKM5_ASCLU
MPQYIIKCPHIRRRWKRWKFLVLFSKCAFPIYEDEINSMRCTEGREGTD